MSFCIDSSLASISAFTWLCLSKSSLAAETLVTSSSLDIFASTSLIQLIKSRTCGQSVSDLFHRLSIHPMHLVPYITCGLYIAECKTCTLCKYMFFYCIYTNLFKTFNAGCNLTLLYLHVYTYTNFDSCLAHGFLTELKNFWSSYDALSFLFLALVAACSDSQATCTSSILLETVLAWAPG